MPHSNITPEQWLELIETRARGLREAGVKSINLHGVQIELTPPTDPVIKAEPDEGDQDPLHDPITYGRRDGRVPGFRLHGEGEDEN